MRPVMYLLIALIAGGLLVGLGNWLSGSRRPRFRSRKQTVEQILCDYLGPAAVDEYTILERTFPHRVRVDLQRALDALIRQQAQTVFFTGVRSTYDHQSISMAQCLTESERNPLVVIPPEYESVDVGEAEPIPVLKNGLWVLDFSGVRLACLFALGTVMHRDFVLNIHLAIPGTTEGADAAARLIKTLEQAIAESSSYRGKALSLEKEAASYRGQATGIKVHRLKAVQRDQVILPESTLELLERNVLQFVRQRKALNKLGQSVKKGLLFYGPPGTGKTHTIQYLASALPEHTTLLVSAEQVGNLPEYMLLARLLQPSLVVLEDADLIGRRREQMNSPCEEVILNKLLNEMDGLQSDAEIMFILTTNRPEALEDALAARPGRIDQAIEFPRPDAVGRAKLVELYAQGLVLSPECKQSVIARTEGVSAAFIKELMRRVAQFYLERGGEGEIQPNDVEQALGEMLFKGSPLNARLLGGVSESLPS